jgi:hypothetical protein
MLLFLLSSIRSFLPFFLPCFASSFLPSLLLLLLSTIFDSQVKWSGIRSRSWCSSVYVCVCVLAQLISSPIYAKVSTSGKVDVGRVTTMSSSQQLQQLCVLCCWCCGRKVGGQTVRPPFFFLSLSLSLSFKSKRRLCPSYSWAIVATIVLV